MECGCPSCHKLWPVLLPSEKIAALQRNAPVFYLQTQIQMAGRQGVYGDGLCCVAIVGHAGGDRLLEQVVRAYMLSVY